LWSFQNLTHDIPFFKKIYTAREASCTLQAGAMFTRLPFIHSKGSACCST
jgi:hypothetical protein